MDIEVDGARCLVHKPNQWKEATLNYPFQLKFFVVESFPLSEEELISEVFAYNDIVGDHGRPIPVKIRSKNGKYGLLFRLGIDEAIYNRIQSLEGELEYAFDSLTVQTFPTGVPPPRPTIFNKKTNKARDAQHPYRRDERAKDKAEPPAFNTKDLNSLKDYISQAAPNRGYFTQTTAAEPKDKDQPPVNPRMETEAMVRDRVWRDANEMCVTPPGCIPSFEFWSMAELDRASYAKQLKHKLGFIPSMYQKPRSGDIEALETSDKRAANGDPPIKYPFTFPPDSFDVQEYREQDMDTRKKLLELYSE